MDFFKWSRASGTVQIQWFSRFLSHKGMSLDRAKCFFFGWKGPLKHGFREPTDN